MRQDSRALLSLRVGTFALCSLSTCGRARLPWPTPPLIPSSCVSIRRTFHHSAFTRTPSHGEVKDRMRDTARSAGATATLSSSSTSSLWTSPLPDRLPLDCFTCRTCRGSGPGGQGVNSSSNKVELRVSLEALAPYLHPDLLHWISPTLPPHTLPDAADRVEVEPHPATSERLPSSPHRCTPPSSSSSPASSSSASSYFSNCITADGKTLYTSSHAHRSAYQNEAECHRILLQKLVQAGEALRRFQSKKAAEMAERRQRLRGPQRCSTRNNASELDTDAQDTNLTSSTTIGGSSTGSGFQVDPSFYFNKSSSKNISKGKDRRRRKSHLQKMQRSARKGEW